MKNVHNVVANAINNLTKVTFKKEVGITPMTRKEKRLQLSQAQQEISKMQQEIRST